MGPLLFLKAAPKDIKVSHVLLSLEQRCAWDGSELKFNPPTKEVLDRAAELVVSACKKSFGESLQCVTLKGSAVKGDFIQGYSDLDFYVFVKPEVLEDERTPRAEHALRFQKAFGKVHPEEHGASQFQIYFVNCERYPADWIPPVESTYKVIWGELPMSAAESDNDTYMKHAREYLTTVEDSKRTLLGRFVDKPDSRVPPIVRLLGATLKSYMHSVLAVLTEKPKDSLKLRLDQIVAQVEEGIGSEGHFSAFFECVSDWPRVLHDGDYARTAFKVGLAALDEIAEWHRTRANSVERR